MALLPQDRQSQVMLLITIAMAGLGWAFWNYWAQPTGQQIESTRVEIDSLQRIIDRAKQDLASGTVEDLRRKVEEYTSRSEEHTSELQSRGHLVCRLLLEKKKKKKKNQIKNT